MDGTFLQSENWEKFQQSLGNETSRVEDALFIRHRLPLGLSYLYCPRPNVLPSFDAIKQIAKKSDVFVWVDFVSLHTSYSTLHTSVRRYPKQPKATLILDLTKSEDELLAQMHPKTRYNIRLAQKHSVAVEQSTDLDIFWRLLQETNQRDQIRSHSKEHYQKLLAVAGTKMFIAQYRNQPLSAAISISDEDSFYYLYGASTQEQKQVMAPYLLQWEIIKYAKAQGSKHYDFWGVDEQRYPGVTRFKMGFAPNAKITTYPDAMLVPIRPIWFRFYKLFKK